MHWVLNLLLSKALISTGPEIPNKKLAVTKIYLVRNIEW